MHTEILIVSKIKMSHLDGKIYEATIPISGRVEVDSKDEVVDVGDLGDRVRSRVGAGGDGRRENDIDRVGRVPPCKTKVRGNEISANSLARPTRP